MKKSWILTSTALAIGASLFLAADTAQAQRRGGISVGIGGGGIRVGTGGYGGYGFGNQGFGNQGYGNQGYGWGGYNRGYGSNYYGGSGFGITLNPGRSSYYNGYYDRGYNSTPGYYSGGTYYDSPSYYSTAPAYGSRSDGSYESSEPMGALTVTVNVPRADAKVTFDGVTSTSTGTARSFQTSNLYEGRPYNFQVNASWMQDGKMVERSRTVSGLAGQSVSVDFNADRTPGVSNDRFPADGSDRTPDRVVPPSTGSDRLPGVDINRDPLRDRDPIRERDNPRLPID